MTKTVKGRLTGGRVELIEPLDIPDGTVVEVTFDAADEGAAPRPAPRRAYFGMHRPADGRYTTEEDWNEAKKLWERDL